MSAGTLRNVLANSCAKSRAIASRLLRSAPVLAVCCAFAPALVATAAHAQSFPTQTLRWVVPFPPGGGLDAVSRMISPQLQQQIGQTVLVENKAGGSGFIGTLTVAKAKPDGHMVMIQALGMSINPSIYQRLPYDPKKDVEPVALIAVVPVVIAFGNHLKFANLQEFITAAKAAPGKYKGAAFVTGSATLMFELFKMQAGADIQIVHYRGAGPAVNAVSGGESDFLIMDGGSMMAAVKAGRLRAVAVAAKERMSDLPDVPTTVEAGLPGYQIEFWYAAFTTGGVPKAVVEKLNTEINKATADPGVAARLRSLGLTPVQRSAEAFRAQHHREMDIWAEVVKKSGFKPIATQ